MAKKAVLLMLPLAVGLAAYFGVAQYNESRNTPEAVMESFVQDLAQGEAAKTYERFSDRYAREYQESEWQAYVSSLDGFVGAERLSQASLADNFNVFAEGSNPQRFTYSAQVKGRQYWASAVILKQDTTWKIDDFQGSYK